MLLLLILNLAACLFALPAQAAEFEDAAYFDHKYLADKALGYHTNAPVLPAERAGVIPDLIGTAHLQYAGDNVAPLADSHPKYFRPVEGREGYIFFDNVANEKFATSAPLSQPMAGQRELWLVMRRPGKAGSYDAYLDAWKSGFFTDKGNESIGLSNEAASDGKVPIPYLIKVLVRIKLDGAHSEVFINGERVTGPLPGGYFNEGYNEEWVNLVIGSDNNNAYWDWYASYYKQGNFTADEARQVYAALSVRHEIGTGPSLPYASNIRIVRKGDTYRVKYIFNNPLGFAEDTLRTEYQFIYGGRGAGAQGEKAYYLSELENKKFFNRRDFAVGNTQGKPELFSFMAPFAWFRMTVKVYDTQGNSWRFQTAEWTVDNEYDYFELPDEQFFNHKYLADKAQEYQSNAPISGNRRAGVIPDLIGTAHLQYAGDNVAPLADSYPKYFKAAEDKEGYIFFDNVFNEKFTTTAPLSEPMTGQRELWLVMRRPGKAGSYDAYLDAFDSGFFSDKGNESVGLSNEASDGKVIIPYNTKAVVRIKLDGSRSEVFINNKRVTGPLPGGYFNEGYNEKWVNLVIGSDNNNAYWDWYASYYKQGNFTDYEAADVFHALSVRHEIGTGPHLPYASDIKIHRQGDKYFVSYVYHHPSGIPEDSTRTEYQFIYGGRGTAPQVRQAYQIPVPDLNTRKSINRQEYAVGNSLGNPELFSPIPEYAWFRITVKVYDTAGNSWRFQTAEWIMDHEYPYTGFPDEVYFDHKFLADSAYLYKGATRVGDNQRAGRIPDLIGDADLQYAGDNVAPLTDSNPKYFLPSSDREGYIFFDNVADEKFLTVKPLSQPMTGKRELWLVMRRPGIAASHEAYLNSTRAGYFADRGQGRVGLAVQGDCALMDDPEKWPYAHDCAIAKNGDVPIPLYSKALVRIKLDGMRSEIFVNNKRVEGPLAGGYFSEGHNGMWENLLIGADTHNAYWDWYASYYKRGNFSAQQAHDVYQALAKRHEIGTLPTLPYATNIRIVRDGDHYSVKYDYHNPLGHAEDKGRTEFQLVYGGRGRNANIFNSHFIPGVNEQLTEKKFINRQEYAVGNALGNPEVFSPIPQYAWFRMTVKVYDTQGNSWRYQTTEWRVDNEYDYTGFPDELFFDHKYLADKALEYNTQMPVSDNRRAGYIPDLIGNAHMKYSGDNIAPLTNSYPTYFRPVAGKEGYIFFDNVTDEKFSTISKLVPEMSGQRELWLVMRRPGVVAQYEPYLSAWKSGYFADRGQGKIGLGNAGPEAVSLNGEVAIPEAVKSLVRIKLNGSQSEIFINNVRVPGPLPDGYFSEGSNEVWENLLIGSDTHNAYWDWYASYYKRGNFTANQANDVYAALAERHEIGSLPDKPYASDIKIVKTGDIFTVNYTYHHPAGIAEDKTRTEYQFIYGSMGPEQDVKGSTYIAALENKGSFNRWDYTIGNTMGNPQLLSPFGRDAWFRMTVKVYDVQGNSWRFQSAPWIQDNDYPLVALPVSLTFFEARNQDGQALLSWQTATETNNRGFEVQGTANGRDFVTLGFVDSPKGNSTQPTRYSFLDPAFSQRRAPVYYYRLRQVDIAGTSTYSSLVALHKQAGKAMIAPVPFHKDFTVNLEALQPGDTEVALLDITGKVVYRQSFPVQSGPQQLRVQPQAALPKGLYVIQFESRGEVVRLRTMKN